MSGKFSAMEQKVFRAEIKSAGDSGSFTALASVFGNVDLVGDRMLPGSFSKTLEQWRESGDPIPVIWSHQHDDPMSMIGKADPNDVVETDEGLVVRGELDLNNPKAKQVHGLMMDRVLKGWSFAYKVPEGGQKRGKDGVNDVSEVDLIEVGPTLVGANPEAHLQAVKSGLTKAVDPATHLDGMMSMAQEFIDTEPEAADVSLMREIMDRLRSLGASEMREDTSTRSTSIEDHKDEEPKVAKSRRQDLGQTRRDLTLLRLGR